MASKLVHAVFECACGWSCQDYLTAQKKAADHARRTGHQVSGELGYAVVYERNRRHKERKHGRG